MALKRTTDVPPVLAAGDLTFATTSGEVTGPAGTSTLSGSAFVMLRESMMSLGQEVSVDDMVAAIWPDPHREPRNVEHSLRQTATRVRDVLEEVGLSRTRLTCRYRGGFVMAGEPVVVRVLRPAQAAALDAVLASHPDRALVAQVAA